YLGCRGAGAQGRINSNLSPAPLLLRTTAASTKRYLNRKVLGVWEDGEEIFPPTLPTLPSLSTPATHT
ncbi:hypothetical protein, partial [Nostoc sp. FACHB-87]|uniref:hypothetical protein n=1 Tax=Nostoc sp. FACHB-87 TaxID=2692841 RepID=UPI001A7E4791